MYYTYYSENIVKKYVLNLIVKLQISNIHIYVCIIYVYPRILYGIKIVKSYSNY